MHPAAGAGVLAFRVLAHDHPVEPVRSDALQRTFDSRQQPRRADIGVLVQRSEEHTSELQSLMRISYAVFCLKKKKKKTNTHTKTSTHQVRHLYHVVNQNTIIEPRKPIYL